MYDIDRRVYVKSLDKLGRVTERNYVGSPRRAQYLVTFTDGDFLTGSMNLRAADTCCDACGRWLPAGSFIGGSGGMVARDDDYFAFCFLCTRESLRAYGRGV